MDAVVNSWMGEHSTVATKQWLPEEAQDFKTASSTILLCFRSHPLNFRSNPCAVGIFHHSNTINSQNTSLKMLAAGNSWMFPLAREHTAPISEHQLPRCQQTQFALFHKATQPFQKKSRYDVISTTNSRCFKMMTLTGPKTV